MIIDTETHIFYFARPSRTTDNPLVNHYAWHEHSGDLLVAEMDNAGVDRTFLISYDAEDLRWDAEHKGYAVEDFAGGRKYTQLAFEAHRDRFWWFNTVRNPTTRDAVRQARDDFDDGASGLKLFPAYVESALDSPGLMKVFEVAAERSGKMLVSFETLRPPESLSLPQYLEQLPTVLKAFPTVNFALFHTGCADPLTPAIEPVLRLVNEFENVYLSTAFPGEIWDDGTEYPFANYQRRMEVLIKAVGSERVMWATDWPWFERYMKYPQAVDSIRLHADYMTDKDKANFLGDTASRFMGSEAE